MPVEQHRALFAVPVNIQHLMEEQRIVIFALPASTSVMLQMQINTMEKTIASFAVLGNIPPRLEDPTIATFVFPASTLATPRLRPSTTTKPIAQIAAQVRINIHPERNPVKNAPPGVTRSLAKV